MTVLKGDVRRAIAMLGDAVSNPTIDAAEFEIQKQSIAQDHANNHNEYEYTTLENSHYNSFRDHMMGQPIRGDADNLSSLTVSDLHNYKAANYFGDNMVVVGTGNINHDEFAAEVNNSFKNVNKTATDKAANSDKCVYVPALLMIRDDEMYPQEHVRLIQNRQERRASQRCQETVQLYARPSWRPSRRHYGQLTLLRLL